MESRWVERIEGGRRVKRLQSHVPPSAEEAAANQERLSVMCAERRPPQGQVWKPEATTMASGRPFDSRAKYQEWLKQKGYVELSKADAQTGAIKRPKLDFEKLRKEAYTQAIESAQRDMAAGVPAPKILPRPTIAETIAPAPQQRLEHAAARGREERGVAFGHDADVHAHNVTTPRPVGKAAGGGIGRGVMQKMLEGAMDRGALDEDEAADVARNLGIAQSAAE